MLVVVAMADASTSFCYRPITMFFSGNGHKPVSFVVEGSSRRMWLLHKEFEKKEKNVNEVTRGSLRNSEDNRKLEDILDNLTRPSESKSFL